MGAFNARTFASANCALIHITIACLSAWGSGVTDKEYVVLLTLRKYPLRVRVAQNGSDVVPTVFQYLRTRNQQQFVITDLKYMFAAARSRKHAAFQTLAL